MIGFPSKEFPFWESGSTHIGSIRLLYFGRDDGAVRHLCCLGLSGGNHAAGVERFLTTKREGASKEDHSHVIVQVMYPAPDCTLPSEGQEIRSAQAP